MVHIEHLMFRQMRVIQLCRDPMLMKSCKKLYPFSEPSAKNVLQN